jgi:3-oxoacyl-[acyl-carrier-protein] synthase II
MKKRRIVITGMGVVSCFGNDVEHYYDQLLAGRSGVHPIQGFDTSEYPTKIAGEILNFDPGEYLDKKQARRFDPYLAYGVVAGKKAMEHAHLKGAALEKLDRTRCGVVVGTGMGGMHTFEEGVVTLNEKGVRRITPFFVPYIITNMAGALLAIEYGFMGPNYPVSTACATANYAIFLAAEHIRRGDADMMICGGVEACITSMSLAGFVAIGAVSQRNDAPEKASRPFDRDRDGFVMGEGAGIFILEELEHAKARGANILAEFLGGAFNNDAYHITDTRPDGSGQAACLRMALKDAAVTPEQVDYINAHATSTPVGDIPELLAIHQVFGSHTRNMKLNATKSLIGHGLGAAGGLEAIAVIQALRRQRLHPTINLDNPVPELGDLDPIAHVAKDAKVDVACSNSFGFGGHNSVLVFGKAP